MGKFVRFKNCQSTTFALIINKTKLMKLLMSSHNIFSRVLKKKKLFQAKNIKILH